MHSVADRFAGASSTARRTVVLLAVETLHYGGGTNRPAIGFITKALAPESSSSALHNALPPKVRSATRSKGVSWGVFLQGAFLTTARKRKGTQETPRRNGTKRSDKAAQKPTQLAKADGIRIAHS